MLEEKEKKKLEEKGWQQLNAGRTRQVNYNVPFILLRRVRNLADVMAQKSYDDEKMQKLEDGRDGKDKEIYDEISKKSSEKNPGNPHDCRNSGKVSNTPMGTPEVDLTPLSDVSSLPILSDFSSYASLRAIRSDTDSIVIAYDSEWYYPDGNDCGERKILSWQFATIRGSDLREYVFLDNGGRHGMRLELAIGRILDDLGEISYDVRSLFKYRALTGSDSRLESVFNSKSDAETNSKHLYDDGKKVHKFVDWSGIPKISVTLLCHAAKADLTAFDQHMKNDLRILEHLSDIQGGLISLKPVFLHPQSVNPEYANNKHVYNMVISFADTMCHAPGKRKSLKTLGHVVGYEKIELPEGVIEKMHQYLLDNPCGFVEYASNDAVVTLLYASALYGYNKTIPCTITSATSKVAKVILMEYLGCKTENEYLRKYGGMNRVSKGLVPAGNRPGYVESKAEEPVSPDAADVQSFCAMAFCGGYNICSDVGYFPRMTYDYDLKNAYPTAMCLVPDIDWGNPIKKRLDNQNISLKDFSVNGLDFALIPFVGYITFEFPKSVRYPCIPVRCDKGFPIYPRTSKGLDGVYASGPDVYLALRLGAKVYVKRGYFLRALLSDSGNPSFSLSVVVKQMVADRCLAKKIHGKGSLEELILKVMVNSCYGKVGQNVIQKDSWVAMLDEMVDQGGSPLTNPVSACMITSIIRAVLIAAQNQCAEINYMTCSVTTDGFISDCPSSLLYSLDLYGFREHILNARKILTGEDQPEIWEIKHQQDDLVNFTTRGNVSLLSGGVCAHNSVKSGYEPDTYEDRKWLMESVLGRTGRVSYTEKQWPEFRELVKGAAFRMRINKINASMDFDLKRKPDRSSFCTTYPVVDGTCYEIANFSTVPYDSVQEFSEYRAVMKKIDVLRTEADWKLFYGKKSCSDSKHKIHNLEWSILFSCIMGYRGKLFEIPTLDKLTAQDRYDWINSHNTSGKKFTAADWKNAGRANRLGSMLPEEMLIDKLAELQRD